MGDMIGRGGQGKRNAQQMWSTVRANEPTVSQFRNTWQQEPLSGGKEIDRRGYLADCPSALRL
jgi:hypothetical protein